MKRKTLLLTSCILSLLLCSCDYSGNIDISVVDVNNTSLVSDAETVEASKDVTGSVEKETETETTENTICTESMIIDYERMVKDDLVLSEWTIQDAVYENGIWSKPYFMPVISREKISAYKNPDKDSEKIYFDEGTVIYFDKTDRNEWIHITDQNNEGWIYFKNQPAEILIEMSNQEYKTLLEAFVCCVQGDFDYGMTKCYSVSDGSIFDNIPEGKDYTALWFDNYDKLVEFIDLYSDGITGTVCEQIKEHADRYKNVKYEHDGKYESIKFFVFVYKGNESINHVTWIIEEEKMCGFADTGDGGTSSCIQVGIANHIYAKDDIILAK